MRVRSTPRRPESAAGRRRPSPAAGRRRGVAAAGVTAFVLAVPPTLMAPEAAAATTVPLSANARRCDASLLDVSPRPAFPGSGTVLVAADGGALSADITFQGRPGVVYQARLVQLPRSAASPCAGSEPGVATGLLVLDGMGTGTLRLTDAIEPGATGAWVNLFVPSAETQQPTNAFSSDFVARF